MLILRDIYRYIFFKLFRKDHLKLLWVSGRQHKKLLIYSVFPFSKLILFFVCFSFYAAASSKYNGSMELSINFKDNSYDSLSIPHYYTILNYLEIPAAANVKVANIANIHFIFLHSFSRFHIFLCVLFLLCVLLRSHRFRTKRIKDSCP